MREIFVHINNWSRMKPGLRLLARTRFSKLRDVIMSQKSLNLDAARRFPRTWKACFRAHLQSCVRICRQMYGETRLDGALWPGSASLEFVNAVL